VPYRIKERQRQAAKRLNVAIRPSSDKNKKLDVYKNGFLIAILIYNGEINVTWGFQFLNLAVQPDSATETLLD
jgi:hypothetical protein